MNGGALPLMLMSAAVGLGLSYAPVRLAWLGVAGFALAALLVAFAPVPQGAAKAIYLGFWLSAIAAASLVLLPRAAGARVALIAAINSGAWAGALTALGGSRAALVFAVPLTLIFLPARRFACGGRDIVLKVLSSWLIAISALAAFVSLVPTPGYEPDHME